MAKYNYFPLVVLIFSVGLSACTTPTKPEPTITEAEVNAAQQAWCDGLVKIGQTSD